ncbi:MAG: hypothetical protein ACHQET_01480 [Chitinophagales bacterium]
MKTSNYSFCLILVALTFKNVSAQVQKYDSTMMLGKGGFRVTCKNKNPNENSLSVKLIGFESTARGIDVFIKGTISKAEIDDLNDDGWPDLLMYAKTGVNGVYGTVYGLASDHNHGVIPFLLPDVMMDGKISSGYKGHDEFELFQGSLIQRFPLYKSGDSTDHPTGGKRVVQYRIVPGEKGGYDFKIIRSYEIKPGDNH